MRPFRILLVCTGNICRSAMAEAMLVGALDGSPVARDVEIRSAGTHASEGAPMTAEAQRELARFGVEGGAHLAHRLELADVLGADLILALSRDHRRAVVALDPRASSRVFTLTEFVRLIESPEIMDAAAAPSEPANEYEFDGSATDIPSTLRSTVSTVSASRGYLPPPESDDEFDIADPYGRSARVYSRVAAVIGGATTTLAEFLVGSGNT